MSKYIIKYIEDPTKKLKDLKVGDIFKSKWRSEHKFYHFDVVTKIEDGIIFGDDMQEYPINDILFICRTVLFIDIGEDYEYFGEISKAAIWCSHGLVLKEEQIKPVYAIPVRKTYRNGNKESYVTFEDNYPTIQDIESAAMAWAENDGAGQNYGYEVFWDEKTVYVKFYKILGACGHFH